MIRRERLQNEFLEMVRIPSPSRKEGAIADYLQKKLAQLGFEIKVDTKSTQATGSETGNLIAYLPGTLENLPSILFSTHMDTVTPCATINPQVTAEKICADGTSILGADDKAGIAAIIEAIIHLKEENIPHRPIEMVITTCEEVGLLGSRYLDYCLLQSSFGYVLDGGGAPGVIINSGPAQDQFRAIIKGRAAHAGINPEEGISAIQVAAHAITKMKLLRIDEETTSNIGYICGGGATNIVTESVELHGEARSLNNEKLVMQSAHIKKCLEETCREYGAKLDWQITREYDAFIVPENSPVVQLAVKAAESIGLKPEIISSGGGSDVNYFNTQGLATINLGTGMSKVHTTEEYILTEDLTNLAKLVAAIITQPS